MKILYLAHNAINRDRGPRVHVLAVCRELARRGSRNAPPWRGSAGGRIAFLVQRALVAAAACISGYPAVAPMPHVEEAA